MRPLNLQLCVDPVHGSRKRLASSELRSCRRISRRSGGFLPEAIEHPALFSMVRQIRQEKPQAIGLWNCFCLCLESYFLKSFKGFGYEDWRRESHPGHVERSGNRSLGARPSARLSSYGSSHSSVSRPKASILSRSLAKAGNYAMNYAETVETKMAYDLLTSSSTGAFSIRSYPFLWLAKLAARPAGPGDWYFSITRGRHDIIWRREYRTSDSGSHATHEDA